MSKKPLWKRRFLYLILLAGVLFVLIAGGALVKLDYGSMFTRAAWQIPGRVVKSLDIQPGSHVADIGAGDGYFTFFLAEAVGPDGRVYAVEIDEQAVRKLQDKARELGYENVTAIMGEPEDPDLPDGEIDLVFLCNSYHHIKNRKTYFENLRSDLTESARVAVIDIRVNLLIRLMLHAGHWTPVEIMVAEMLDAGYRRDHRFEFLPLQNFLIFSPENKSADH